MMLKLGDKDGGVSPTFDEGWQM